MQKQGGAEMNGWQEMEISAVLSVEGKDEVYVCSRLVALLMHSYSCLCCRSLVWKAVAPPAISVLHLSRQTFRQIYTSAVHHPTGRTAKQSSRRLCTQSGNMARHASGKVLCADLPIVSV